MPNIYGRVYYSQDSYARIITSPTIVPSFWSTTLERVTIQPQTIVKDVPIALIDKSTGKGHCILSTATGFTFTNVPTGSYSLIEAYGITTTGSSPFIWDNSTVVSLNTISPKDPPLLFFTSKGLTSYDANDIASISRNTIGLNNFSSDTTINFIDAPVKNIAINLNDYFAVEGNLITVAHNGDFDNYSSGVQESTSPTINPYPNLSELNYIDYSSNTPNGNYYTISNLINKQTFLSAWFDTADHTTKDERGRFEIINGDAPGKYIFKSTCFIEPNNSYVFAAWVMNLYRVAAAGIPKFSAQIMDTYSKVILFNDNLTGNLLVTKVPTWKQIGATFNSRSATSIDIQFISQGPEVWGNDYAIDDLRLRKLTTIVPKPIITKSVNKDKTYLNTPFEYTLTINNPTSFYLSNCIFYDYLPQGVTLVSPTLSLNISTVSTITSINTSLLNTGINISDLIRYTVKNSDPYFINLSEGRIPSGLTCQIKFAVEVTDIDPMNLDNRVYNHGHLDYLFSGDTDASAFTRILNSNQVETQIVYPKLSATKSAALIDNGVERQVLPTGASIMAGSKIAYRLVLTNTGWADATGVQIKDSIPKVIIPDYSLSTTCYGISQEIITPVHSGPNFLTCIDITSISGDTNNIKISNLKVPAATVISGITIYGQSIIRIYGTIHD